MHADGNAYTGMPCHHDDANMQMQKLVQNFWGGHYYFNFSS